LNKSAPLPRTKGIRELAAELGVSIGTVSRALNGKSDVNPTTRKRVLEAAKLRGYSPQQSGRSLRQGSTRAIGLLWEIPFGREAYGDSFFLSLFIGIQEALMERGYDLAILLDRPGAKDADVDPLLKLRETVQRRQFDAFIIPWTRVVDARLAYCADQRVPFAALGRSTSGGRHCWIDLDFEAAMAEATDRLMRLGHHRIGLVLASSDLMQSQFFVAGYRRALEAHGLPFDSALSTSDDASPAGGQRAVARLLDDAFPPSALIVIDSGMAIGAYQCLAERGMRAGRDMAIIGGVQDNPILEFMSPPLTCFGLNSMALGRRLAEAVLIAIDGKGDAFDQTCISELWPLHLIARNSDSVGSE
jgi:DNA-binding LacI/PurR family transcriptional regulator